MNYPAPSISRNETALLAALDRNRLSRVTMSQAKIWVGATAPKVVANMARKGILDRVGRGIYTVRPLRAAGRPWSASAFVAVEQSLGEELHYIGGPAALTIHRLTDQAHSSVVDVFLPSRRKTRIFANAKIRFHSIPASSISTGITSVPIEEIQVQFSDPEKTLIDALNHPAAFGGIGSGVRVVARALGRVDSERLVTYALELMSMSGLQRLGVLMERSGIPPSELRRLAARVAGTTNKPAMVPGPRRGPFNTVWRILENDRDDVQRDTPTSS